MKTTSSRSKRLPKLEISADGGGVANHVGTVALRELTDVLGLTTALSSALASSRQRSSAHDPGRVARDLVVMLADGGDCVSDLGALRDQPEVFGAVASISTAWRIVDGITEKDLDGMREARCQARERAWRRGAAPSEIVLDIDATLVLAHSEKEQAASNYKRGFGFHPMLCYLDESEEALSGILRRGNATANDSADNIEVLEMALKQLPKSKKPQRILVRADSSGATHAFIARLRELEVEFSVGMDLYDSVKEAILNTPETAWLPAITQEGDGREGAWVCELSELDLSSWPSGTRAICRRERPHPGAQLKFTDHQGFRFQVFITDQSDADIVELEARHRGHARVENRIRCAKDTGLRNFPFHDFHANQVWLELVLAAQDLIAFFQRLCLRGEARGWEPKRLRYRLLHTAARLVHTGRRVVLKLQRNWHWTLMLYDAFRRLRKLAVV